MQFESTTQPISWFQKEYREGTMTLRPPYQRKPVWAARQKCYLIESILLGYPVPEIFIHQITSPAGETRYAVVDGQQRIRTVLQFLGLTTLGPDGEPEPDESEFTGFTLDKFDRQGAESPWLGKRFADLSADEKVKFYEYRFHIRFLFASDETELRTMFARLNRFLTALSAQELRHSIYVGPFPKLSEQLADDEYWLEQKLVTRALIRRMTDVDFVSQLVIGVINGPQGGSAAVVDEYYRIYEDYEIDEGIPEQRRVVKLFGDTRSLIARLFPKLGEEEGLRWSNRADYYSLFVAVAELLRDEVGLKGELKSLRQTLTEFSGDVNRRLANKTARVSAVVSAYVAAVEKGVNDRARRAERHAILIKLIKKTVEAG